MRVSVFIILLPVGLAAYGGIIYYRLAWLHTQSRHALRHVDLQLNQHHHYIPHLVTAISTYAHHERDVFERVVQARLRSLAAQTLEERMLASTHLSHALHHLFVVSESCTMLHTNDEHSLVHMQVMLSEQKIALARDYYNQVIGHYNSRIQRFPNNVMAQLAGFRPKALFEHPELASHEYASMEC